VVFSYSRDGMFPLARVWRKVADWNRSPVYAIRGLNYGTAAYYQPQSILVGRVYQLGAIVRF